MHRSSSLSSAVATAAIPAPGADPVLLTRGPPPGNDRAPAGNGATVSAELTRYLTEDHDRIAQSLNDVVVRRIFAAGLDLHVALGLIGEHRGAGKIYHAIDELDNAIRDIRDAVFAARTIDDVGHDGEPGIALYAACGESRAWRLFPPGK
jgi:signal transduction histidine kinase